MALMSILWQIHYYGKYKNTPSCSCQWNKMKKDDDSDMLFSLQVYSISSGWSQLPWTLDRWVLTLTTQSSLRFSESSASFPVVCSVCVTCKNAAWRNRTMLQPWNWRDLQHDPYKWRTLVRKVPILRGSLSQCLFHLLCMKPVNRVLVGTVSGITPYKYYVPLFVIVDGMTLSVDIRLCFDRIKTACLCTWPCLRKPCSFVMSHFS